MHDPHARRGALFLAVMVLIALAAGLGTLVLLVQAGVFDSSVILPSFLGMVVALGLQIAGMVLAGGSDGRQPRNR